MGTEMAVVGIVPSDLLEITGLLNRRFRGSHEWVDYTPCTFQAYLDDMEPSVFVLKDDGLKGVATFFKGPWGNKIDWLAVEPGPKSKEWADALVFAIEKSQDVDRLYTLIEEGDPSIPEWTQRGYCEDGGWRHMIAELSEERPVPPVKCDVILRTMKESDLPKMISLTNVSFGFDRLSMDCIEEWKREDPGFGLDWIFLAEAGGRLVSMLVSKEDAEYRRDFGLRRGYLGPAATLPEFRNKGLAAALTVMAMNSLTKRGLTSVSLYTNILNTASVSLLKKLGFEGVRTYFQFSKTLKTRRVSSPHP